MPSLFTEDTYEQAIIELFENMGYEHLYAPDYDRDYTSPLLDSVLRAGTQMPLALPADTVSKYRQTISGHHLRSICARIHSITISIAA